MKFGSCVHMPSTKLWISSVYCCVLGKHTTQKWSLQLHMQHCWLNRKYQIPSNWTLRFYYWTECFRNCSVTSVALTRKGSPLRTHFFDDAVTVTQLPYTGTVTETIVKPMWYLSQSVSNEDFLDAFSTVPIPTTLYLFDIAIFISSLLSWGNKHIVCSLLRQPGLNWAYRPAAMAREFPWVHAEGYREYHLHGLLVTVFSRIYVTFSLS